MVYFSDVSSFTCSSLKQHGNTENNKELQSRSLGARLDAATLFSLSVDNGCVQVMDFSKQANALLIRFLYFSCRRLVRQVRHESFIKMKVRPRLSCDWFRFYSV